MNEPRDLSEARRRLARAEVELDTEHGLRELQEGLALLDCVADDPAAGAHGLIARNLGKTYAGKIHERIKQQLESGQNLAEAALRHAFDVVRCFDDARFDVPPARGLKIELVRRLIDIHYEGYPPAEKQLAYEELAKISGVDPD